MSAGLPTALHLAASLLGLFTGVGLALVTAVGVRDTAERRLVATVAGGVLSLGALAFATGHGIAGALLSGAPTVAVWLRAAGLVAIAAGLSAGFVRHLTAAGPTLLVPLMPLPPAVVASVAGALGGLRALLVGWSGLPLGIGLLAWGAAEGLGTRSAAASAWVGLSGSLAVGVWLWWASAKRLLAKFVIAFVASLLVLVVLVAGTLGVLGSSELVEEELAQLDEFSRRLAGQISQDWPREAIDAARAVQPAGATLLAIPPDSRGELQSIYRTSFRAQDFFLLVGSDGRPVSSYSEDPTVLTGAFILSLTGAPLVDNLLDGASEDGSLLPIGGRLVAVGGVRLEARGARAEDPPLGVLLTGRLVDERWAAQTAADLGVGVLVDVGGTLSVASPDVGPESGSELSALTSGGFRGAVQLDSATRYASTAPVLEPTTRTVLGQVVTVSGGEALSQLEVVQTRRLFLLALVGALLSGVVAATVTGKLVAPIRRLTAAAAAVREGHLDVRTDVEARDEVGTLGRTFNEMTASLAAQSAQLRDAAAVQARLRARLEALTSSMSDALVAVDSDGKIITFNPAAESLVGRDVREVLGLPLEEVLHGHGPGEQSPAEALGAPDSEAVTAVQVLLESAQGGYTPTAVTAAPVRDDAGEILGRVLVLRDVTREAEVERMKSEFLSNVSHELRTPLTPIKGYAEVLARRDVGPDATRQFAGEILASTGRLERVVAMIVDFAALDSGRLELRREPTDVSALVDDLLGDWRERHPDRDFRRRIARSLPPVVVDPGMLRRCLDELVDNAVKFSPGGNPVSIVASLDGVESDDEPVHGGRVRIGVRDRGVGIEPDTLAGIFQDFYQVDASETRHYGGLGLGLALVRRIVEGLRGGIEVESEIGTGSTFHLLLPVADTSDDKDR